MVDFNYKQRPTTKDYLNNFDGIFNKDDTEIHRWYDVPRDEGSTSVWPELQRLPYVIEKEARQEDDE